MEVGKTLGKIAHFVKTNKNVKLQPKISPDEVELNSYLEREKQDKIKKQLEQFRKQDSDNIFRGNKFDQETTIFNVKPYPHKKDTILKQKNNLLHGKSLLDTKNFMLK